MRDMRGHAALFAFGLLLMLGSGPEAPIAEAQVVAAAAGRIHFPKEQAARNVFRPASSIEDARRRSRQKLELRLETVERSGELSDEQRERLRLAGDGDIERFFARYQDFERNAEFGNIEPAKWGQIWPEMNRLGAHYRRGLHGDGSLFEKSLASVLDDETFVAYETQMRRRREVEYRQRLTMTLAVIERKIPLTHDQRTRLMNLILETTEPPKFWTEPSLQVAVVVLRIGSIPEEQLRPIFTDPEWKVMSGVLENAAALRNTVEAQLGVLP